MLKWGSKMRPPFFDDFGMEKGGGTDHEGSPPESLKPLKYRRFRSSVPVKKHARSSLDGRRRISVPCPHDPCPEIWVPFLWKKRRLRQRTHKFRASRNMGPLFCGKKSACGNVPTSSGLPEICPPWDSGRKTRFSNGLAYNRSKVSVRKSQIGFVVINFSRSIFPYM